MEGDAGKASAQVTPAAVRTTHLWARAGIAVVFATVAVAIALVRFRVSPLYPTFNDINSDVYVYQEIGNSWLRGYLPYRDVFDVKGPSFFLLFGLFALIRPWSMGPLLVTLALLAFTSLWLAYAIARIHLRQQWLAALAAVVSCVVIYLSISGTKSSFICSEITVPGVLLLLWLTTRWLVAGDEIRGVLWVLDGVVLALVFWARFPGAVPWGGMLVGLLVLVARGALPSWSLRRVVVLHLVGFGAASVVVLAFYAPVLPDALSAYFVAKSDVINLRGELPAEAHFLTSTFAVNTAAAVAMLTVLLVLLMGIVRGERGGALALAIAFCLTTWAALVVVRHPSNFFVPLAFSAVAIPRLLAAAEARGRAVAGISAAGMTALAVAASLAPLAQGVASYGLLRPVPSPTCVDLVTKNRVEADGNVTTTFARDAGNQPILSLGSMLAARTSFVSRLPVKHRFQYVNKSWSRNIGADVVQTSYLEDRTFEYVTIHVSGFRVSQDLPSQIAAADFTTGPSRPLQAAALARNYVPVLSCRNQVLLRAR